MNALARLIALALLAGAATLPADRPAFAQTPPPARGSVRITEYYSTISDNIWDPAPLDTTYTGVLSSSSVTLGSSPLPHVQANAVSAVGAIAEAQGVLTYFVDIAGPDRGISVPIDFSGSYDLSGSATPDGAVGAGVQWFVVSLQDRVSGVCAYAIADDNCSLGSGVFSGTVHALSGGVEDVTVQLKAFTAAGGGSTASAYIDPQFIIDPAWAAQNPGYSLIFSPGIGNGLTAPGPQPSTLGALALGLLGFASLRQKLKSRLRG